MKIIPLTQNKVTIVDDEIHDYLSQWKWYYAEGYARKMIYPEKRVLRMHAAIMRPPKGMQVDHINGDKLDNRKENLRVCTKHQNGWNLRKHMEAKSKYRGVAKHEGQRWRARITFNHKAINLGMFDTETEAALAYNQAAKIFFGEFACLNVLENATGFIN